MLSTVHTTSIIFYAVAASLALLFAIAFFVSAFRKPHARKWYDVLAIVLGSLILFVAFVAAIFAVLLRYPIMGITFAAEKNALCLLMGEKVLISVPAVGVIVDVFARLNIVGIILPCAVFLMVLIAVCTIGAKTRKRPTAAIATQAEDVPTADEQAQESEEVFAESVQDDVLTVQDDVLTEQDGADEVQYSEPQAQEDVQAQDAAVSDTARMVLDEIDWMMGESVQPQSTGIDEELQRAIEEGYALCDAFEPSTVKDEPPVEEVGQEDQDFVQDEPAQEQSEVFADESVEEREEIEEESEQYETEEPVAREEITEEEEEETTAGYAYAAYEAEEAEDEPEIVEESAPEIIEEAQRTVSPERQRKPVIPIEKVENVPPPPRHSAPVFEHADMVVQPRVRTIVRRPTARNIEEIEERAENLKSGSRQKAQQKQSPKANPMGAKTKSATQKKESKASAATETASKAKRTQTKSSPQKQEQEQPKPPQKTVEASASGLPLTRKYIILNRRNAATVFNEYLNSKREQEKAELTGSLNTIIMK